MKALVIAERADAARELCAGARTMADEVVLVSFGEAPEAVADKIARISVPEGTVLDDAADTVISVFEAAGDVAIYTVGAGAFEGAEASGANAVEDVAWVAPATPVKLVSSKPIEKSGVDLNKADVVVAAGRGFAEESELDLARELCDKLGAGLACSRPLTEGVNWLPTELYVGVSGLMLSPKAYVACGISGQMQHMVGCNRAGTMFAINKDKNAPVFKQCDYGIVGDVKDVLPKLVAAL